MLLETELCLCLAEMPLGSRMMMSWVRPAAHSRPLSPSVARIDSVFLVWLQSKFILRPSHPRNAPHEEWRAASPTTHLNIVQPNNSCRPPRCHNFHHVSKQFSRQTAPATFLQSPSLYHGRLQISTQAVSSVYTDQNKTADFPFSLSPLFVNQLSQEDTVTVVQMSHSRTSSTFQLWSVTVADFETRQNFERGTNEALVYRGSASFDAFLRSQLRHSGTGGKCRAISASDNAGY